MDNGFGHTELIDPVGDDLLDAIDDVRPLVFGESGRIHLEYQMDAALKIQTQVDGLPFGGFESVRIRRRVEVVPVRGKKVIHGQQDCSEDNQNAQVISFHYRILTPVSSTAPGTE